MSEKESNPNAKTKAVCNECGFEGEFGFFCDTSKPPIPCPECGSYCSRTIEIADYEHISYEVEMLVLLKAIVEMADYAKEDNHYIVNAALIDRAKNLIRKAEA